jgi:hypothetical protein
MSEVRLIDACIDNKLDIVQWIYSKKYYYISYTELYNCFEYTVSNDRLSISIWLHCVLSTFTFFNIRDNDDYIFRKAAMGGNIETLKWILSLDKNIDVHALSEDAFVAGCRLGHIDMVKWLYNYGFEINSPINLNGGQYFTPFTTACIFNHMNIAKWLLSIHIINIRENDDYIFKKICERKYSTMIDWFCELCSDYSYVYDTCMIKNMHYYFIMDDSKYNNLPVLECPICIEDKEYNIKLDCKHTYCRECYINIDKCPTCMKRIDPNKIILCKKN